MVIINGSFIILKQLCVFLFLNIIWSFFFINSLSKNISSKNLTKLTPFKVKHSFTSVDFQKSIFLFI